MTWNTIMGFISSFALFIPIAIILLLKLGSYRSFAALLIYYSSVIIFNLMSEGYIPTDRAITYYWGVTNNMLDVPLMLTFLTYFSPSKKYTQRMKILGVAFVLFELTVMIITRFTVNGLTIILGPGLIIISGFCLHFFIRYATMARHLLLDQCFLHMAVSVFFMCCITLEKQNRQKKLILYFLLQHLFLPF